MSSVVFLTFRRLSCTVLYNRTVVSQPGAWEVNAGFPTEQLLFGPLFWLLLVFSVSSVCQIVYVCRESWVLLCCRSINKQALLDSVESVTSDQYLLLCHLQKHT